MRAALLSSSISTTGSRNSNEKRLPRPAWLSTWMSPPITRTNCRLMARPSPVPPTRYFASPTCSKGRKIFSMSFRAIPTPLSSTSKRNTASWLLRLIMRTRKLTSPRSVNFTALLNRLSNTWRKRRSSARKLGGRSAAMSHRKASIFSSTLTRMMSATTRMNSCTTTGAATRSILPASTLARSRMSLISASSCSPLCWIVSRPRRWRCLKSWSSCRIWAKPSTALSGVRSSWLMLARNALLARLATSASSLAKFNSAVRSATNSSRWS